MEPADGRPGDWRTFLARVRQQEAAMEPADGRPGDVFGM